MAAQQSPGDYESDYERALNARAAHEAASLRFNLIAETIQERKAALRDAIAALDDEFDAASDALSSLERCGGVPKWIDMPGADLVWARIGGQSVSEALAAHTAAALDKLTP